MAIVGVVVSVGQVIAGVVGAIATFSIATIPVGRILLNIGLNLVFAKLFAPKTPRSVQQRQASILELSLGETPREAIFGLAATGGTLDSAWNDGPENKYEYMIIALADHRVHDLVGYYVNDKYYEYENNGVQGHADFEDNGSKLTIEFRDGAHTAATSIMSVQAVAAGVYLGGEMLKDVAHVAVRYEISDKVWASGRPNFRWVVEGAHCYDPRLDSTVSGGSGSQRYADQTTWTYTDNAAICELNFLLGVKTFYTQQLMVGPGRSLEEVSLPAFMAGANVCDENVNLKAGGTEKRYRVSAVIAANESWIDVEENFAAAMGGELIERDGTIAADPGAAKSAAFTFADADLIARRERTYQGKLGRNELVNTVSVSFVDPDQLWESTTAPLRRSAEDIAADREAREDTLELVFVTSATQAQRIGEIERRKARLQAQAVVPLGPKFMTIQPGDWGTWTSDRFFGGQARTFVCLGVQYEDTGVTVLGLRQINSNVFAWDPANDELDKDAPTYLQPGALPAAAVANFDATPLEITSASGTSAGAISVTWTPPSDVTIFALQLEYRPIGGAASLFRNVDARAGSAVIDVLPVTDVDYEIRATPLTSPQRDALTTAWRSVSLSAPFNLPVPPNNFVGFQNGDSIRFQWTPYADTTLKYEIRAGASFDLGRFVDVVAGASTMVQWPIIGDDDEVLFWIKTVHRTGLYSVDANLWVATVATVGNRNFVFETDYQEDNFPGQLHKLNRTTVGGLPVLELQYDGSVSAERGDYYAYAELVDSFRARTWMEQRASAFVGDVPIWQDTEATWDDLGDIDWEPDIGDPGAARLDTHICTDAPLADALVEGWRFNGSLVGSKSATAPTDSGGTSYGAGRCAQAVALAATGHLVYDVSVPNTFSALMDVRLTALPTADCTLLTVANTTPRWMQLWWRHSDQRVVLSDEVGVIASAALTPLADDTWSIAMWQSASGRGFVVGTRLTQTTVSGSLARASAPTYSQVSVGGSALGGATWDGTEETWDDAGYTWFQAGGFGVNVPFPGRCSDLEIYEGSGRGAAFGSAWDLRGPVGFSVFAPFVVGDYTFEAAYIRIRVTAPQPFAQVLSITRAKLNVDVPDTIDKGESDLLAGGSWVTFNRAFYLPPSVTATQRSGSTRAVVQVEQIERTRFFARLYQSDNPATAIAGRITFAANGY